MEPLFRGIWITRSLLCTQKQTDDTVVKAKVKYAIPLKDRRQDAHLLDWAVEPAGRYTTVFVTHVQCHARRIGLVWHWTCSTDTAVYLPPGSTAQSGRWAPSQLWLVLTAPIQRGMARLSWPEWLVTCLDKISTDGRPVDRPGSTYLIIC